MAHLGDFDASAVLYGKFTTYRPSSGAAFTLGGTPALSVYKDNSTTQSTTGVTLTADFDSLTGLNHFAIDTSADGAFYSAGSFFDIVITTGTVDSVSVVGSVVASFTIRKNSALKPATAGRTLVVDASGLADANAVKVGPTGSGTAQTARDIGASVLLSSGTGTGQIDFTTGIVKSNATQFAGQTITAAAGVTIPSSIASPTNITGGTITTVTNLTNAPTAGDFTATMKTSIGTAVAASAVASVTGNVGGNVTGSVGSVTGLTAANLDVAVSTRLASAGYTAPDNATISAIAGYVDTEVAAIKAKTDLIPASPAAVSDIPTAAAVADQVWDEILSGHAGVGSTGAALSAAGGSGDPWSTALPGAYGAGTAGQIVGDYLDAAVSDVPTATENADALLNRDMSAGTDSGSPTVRTVRQALRALRNKWSLVGTTYTVTKEDDSTTSWSSTVSTSPGADPVSGSDPA